MSTVITPGAHGNALGFNERKVTASTQVQADDYTLFVDATAGAVSVSLPAMDRGRMLMVKKVDATANVVTIYPNNAIDSIDGAASASLSAQNQALHLQGSDSTTWRVFAQLGSATAGFAGNSAVQVARAVFDPSGNTAHRTVGAHGLGVFLPLGAIATRFWYDVGTTFTSATDAGTVAFMAQGAGDLLAAIAISDASNVLDAGIRAGKLGFPSLGADAAHDTQVEVAALFAASAVKMTAARELTATVAVEALTAGKAVLFVEYVIGA